MSVSKNKVKVKKALPTKGRERFLSLDQALRMVHCGDKEEDFLRIPIKTCK